VRWSAALLLRADAFTDTLFVPSRLTFAVLMLDIETGMDVERIIDDIEQLQEMFEAPDIRPLSASDISAANRRHDETLAHSPWFRLWQRYGICCRSESPVLRLPLSRDLNFRRNFEHESGRPIRASNLKYRKIKIWCSA